MESSKPNKITIDGCVYVKARAEHSGNRVIVVLPHGWIFAGNLSEDGKRLTNAVNVRSWKSGGFGGLTKSAKESGAVLDECEDILLDGTVFTVSVSGDWGME